MVARNGHRTYAKTGSTTPKTGSLMYSPARAAITYSHPLYNHYSYTSNRPK